MMAKPWMDTWSMEGDKVWQDVPDGMGGIMGGDMIARVLIGGERPGRGNSVTAEENQATDDRAALICAAPAMARALCLAERAVVEVVVPGDRENYESTEVLCGCCKATWRAELGSMWVSCDGSHRKFVLHEAGCALDAALTAAGLDAAAREAVRGAK